ncbi:MAG: hypothetical protein COB20_09415 [SAR86 cluster bacterium]|uniref:Glycosyltransferase 2-like domain-containing protein n=1 Tax=SAR86 cluster bacterium TaxID=2030880 RepID=A0A2A4X2I7_9GAMM|nr:MAG: hypothetical protein COB20_09415 [SAR86 cluster bacterium]
MSELLELSIIVVNWNVCELLESCLLSIRQYAGLPPEKYEVHVIDNNSSDNSVDMVREKFPEFLLTANSDNKGFGRANNQAFPQCRGKYILLLNPDAEVREKAITQMLKLMDSMPDAGILGARLLNSDGSFQRASGGALPTLNNIAWHWLNLFRLLPKSWAPQPTFLIEDRQGTFDIGWVSGAALMIRPAAVGNNIFDPQFFMYGEDLELCDRVQNSGWRVLYTSKASVMHHLRQSVSKQSSAEILASVVKGNRAYFRNRHGQLRTWIYDLLLTCGYSARWCCFAVLSIVGNDPSYAEQGSMNRHHAGVAFKSFLRCGRQ